MDTKTKRVLSNALYYVEASMKDLQWQWNTMNLEGFNINTSGTPSFDNDDEVDQYLEGMAFFVDHLKEMINEN